MSLLRRAEKIGRYKKIPYNILSLQSYCIKFLKSPKEIKWNTSAISRSTADKGETSGVTLNLAGSLTLEAALVLSFFLFACTSFLVIFPAMQFQLELRCAAEQAAEEAAVFGALEAADNGREVLIGESESNLFSLIKDGAGSLYIRERVLQMTENAGGDFSFVRGGLSGVWIQAEFPERQGGQDVRISWSYALSFPFFPGISLPVSGQLCRRIWSGRTYGEEDGAESEQKSVVYIAENGTVCHKSRDCTYLRLSIKRVRMDEISALRNKEGAKYYPCSRCISEGMQQGSVYITEEGNRYHSDTACGGLQRTIRAVQENETSLPMCSRCGGSHEE